MFVFVHSYEPSSVAQQIWSVSAILWQLIVKSA